MNIRMFAFPASERITDAYAVFQARSNVLQCRRGYDAVFPKPSRRIAVSATEREEAEDHQSIETLSQ
jgi:hypothetical protein